MSIKDEILKSVIEHYISCGKPIGSSQLRDDFDIALSSASIRNHLKALANSGELEKLHSSSGRVPTASSLKTFWQNELENNNVVLKEDDIQRLSNQHNIFSTLVEQQQDKLNGISTVDEQFIILFFNKGAISLEYNKAKVKFFSQFIGFDLYELAKISIATGLIEAGKEIKEYIIKHYARKFNDKVLISFAQQDSQWAKRYFEIFYNLFMIFEIANGVNFIPQIPKNSVVIKKICKIENQDYELILLGNLQSDFRAFF
jgi:heat-inducible transcriptional repressor